MKEQFFNQNTQIYFMDGTTLKLRGNRNIARLHLKTNPFSLAKISAESLNNIK